MSIAEIKQKLHEYIDTAEDEHLLEAVYDLLENGISPDHVVLSDEQLAELDRRMEEYENGSGKSYTWEEAVAMARKAAEK